MQTYPHPNFVKTLILALIFPSMLLLFDVLISLGAHVTIAVYILQQAVTTPGYSYHFPTLDAPDLVVIVAITFTYALGLYLHLGRRKNENGPNYYIPSNNRVNNLEYIRATSV
ncbi:Hypothetical predicted protein [Cloeon dipterum]|uniref:Uncharacterized protein n=1 Tax=Cloeon dipterum TaxID=197152 RepID=A0A8S1E7M4_9INSE|nr:Hypothetical predicted protein [Cloeon dipterum]